MRQTWQTLLAAVAVIAAIFGAAWAKRVLEDRGAAKLRKRHEEIAEEAAKRLRLADTKIDRRTESEISKIRSDRAKLEEGLEKELGSTPTEDEVKRLLEESKK